MVLSSSENSFCLLSTPPEQGGDNENDYGRQSDEKDCSTILMQYPRIQQCETGKQSSQRDRGYKHTLFGGITANQQGTEDFSVSSILIRDLGLQQGF